MSLSGQPDLKTEDAERTGLILSEWQDRAGYQRFGTPFVAKARSLSLRLPERVQ
jgi:hypothetical protein